MAEAQAPTQVQITNCPRKRKFKGMNLKKNIKKKNRILNIEAPLGIIGVPGSGRKTLAYRFANMNRGVFEEEVPVAYSYLATFKGRFSSENSNPNNPYGRYILKLYIYIIEPPAEIDHPDPPLYWIHWNDFCCLIFAFDIRNQISFREASSKLSDYRRQNYVLPICLLAGNKSDRRFEPPAQEVNLYDPEYLNQREVLRDTAYMEAEHLGALYYECSAKNNTDVAEFLAFIKTCARNKRYWVPDFS